MMRRLRDVFVLGICGVACVVFSANIALKVNRKAAEIEVVEAGLPVIEITLGETTLTEIHAGSKDTKYGGNSLSITVGADTAEYSGVEIKGRGNSTWTQPKRPYQIKFQNKVELLGMGKAKKWVLLANALDASQLRNDIAFYLERMLGEDYALTGEFVELHVNGENLGVYFVTPKVEIGKSRIDLRDTMGILVELDNLHVYEGGCYMTAQGNCLIVSDVVTADEAEVAMESFIEQFNLLEAAALQGDYRAVTEIADVEGLAKYYLLEEFTVNPDAYNSSYYFYRDGPDDKIHVAAGWDFDNAMGNRMWQWDYIEDFYSPLKTQVQRALAFGGELHSAGTGKLDGTAGNKVISRLMYYLTDIPEFARLVREIFVGRMQGKKNELLNYVARRAQMADEAIRADNQRWERDDFDEEMRWLRWWIEMRYDYFEQKYGA